MAHDRDYTLAHKNSGDGKLANRGESEEDEETFGLSDLEKEITLIPRYDLVEHLERQSEWSIETFGAGEHVEGVLDHIEEEIEEVRETPDDLEEWIDIVILALDGAHRQGYSPERIATALFMKQNENEERDWPDIEDQEPGKAVNHNKQNEARSSSFLAGSYSALRERMIDLLVNDVTVVSSTEEVVIPLEKRNKLLDDLLECEQDARRRITS